MTKKAPQALTRTEILLGRILLQLAYMQGSGAVLRQLEGLRESGFSTEQVSVIAGTTPATVSVTFQRARKKKAKAAMAAVRDDGD